MYKTEMINFTGSSSTEKCINDHLELIQKYFEISDVSLAFRGTTAFITYKIVNYK